MFLLALRFAIIRIKIIFRQVSFVQLNTILLTAGVTSDVSKQVSKQTNILSRYVANIDWDAIIGKVVSTTIALLLVSLLFILLNLIGKSIIKRSFRHTRFVQNLASNRIETVYSLTRNIFHYTILFFYLYAILSILGVPVGTLLAGAGILSVALGLGAQGFVSDVITGAFILLEQQLAVGDSVKIGTIEGTVHSVGLRTTQVLGYDGTLNFIPNRSITIISNLSRNDMRALIEIGLDPKKEIKEMIALVTNVNEELKPNYPDITSGPNILGTFDSGNGRMVLRIAIYTKNGAQFAIQSAFLERYLEVLRSNGFVIPTSPLNLAGK